MNALPSKSLCENRKSAIQNRKLVGLLAIAAALTVCGVRAAAQQPGKVPRIGLLMSSSIAEAAAFIDALRQGLRELGFVEGKNLVLEIRGGEAKPDRLSDLAAELVGLKVDIIVAEAGPAVTAAKIDKYYSHCHEGGCRSGKDGIC